MPKNRAAIPARLALYRLSFAAYARKLSVIPLNSAVGLSKSQMKFRTITQSFLFIVFALFLVAPSARSQNTQSPSVERSTERSFNVLVLGDSVMWGQGLRPENKSWHHLKIWLAQQTGRSVTERNEAHSGAVIEAANADETRVADDGEVNVAVPTLNRQLGVAVQHYANGPQVDLVLVSGCANDVDVKNVLNSANTTEEVRLLTEGKCGKPMERLLRRITAAFPTSYVIVTGYYPFVSEKTNNDMFMRGLTKRFYKALAGASKLDQEATFNRVVANSDQWYRSSNKSLSEAVKTVNAKPDGAQSRVMFAEIHFLPEHSFRAPKTQLWNFESSLIRKLVVILSFGKILLRPNDQVRKQRAASCKEYWKTLPTESNIEKKERKNQELLCRYAALGHPNRQGVAAYTEAIMGQMKTVLPFLTSK
jgi:lysophospholipase L1-like esterase